MTTSTRRAAEYRRRMRERHRESLALADADRHNDDMDFVEAISELADDA
ncbi:hypothetical protein KL864_16755 [Mycolicibacterium goodii]|nr:hypothetical protein [Mycolicibacterium goodii]MBU8817553.1 hypothetical protein [Mycolicibacterium goodii]